VSQSILKQFFESLDSGNLPYKIVESYIRRWGPTCISVPNLIKIGQTVAEILQFSGFQNGGRPLSWICEIQIF